LTRSRGVHRRRQVIPVKGHGANAPGVQHPGGPNRDGALIVSGCRGRVYSLAAAGSEFLQLEPALGRAPRASVARIGVAVVARLGPRVVHHPVPAVLIRARRV
jgi:hypothetical protein